MKMNKKIIISLGAFILGSSAYADMSSKASEAVDSAAIGTKSGTDTGANKTTDVIKSKGGDNVITNTATNKVETSAQSAKKGTDKVAGKVKEKIGSMGKTEKKATTKANEVSEEIKKEVK